MLTKQGLVKTVIFAALLFGALAEAGYARSGSSQNGNSNSQPAPAATPSIEERKLILEERKATLDRDRLDFDKEKFNKDSTREDKKLGNEEVKTYLSAVSTVVPIIAALITIGYGMWSFRKQTTETAKLQNDSAKLQFEIKAAEIAFSGKTPEAVKNRATVLKKIFGERLPKDFPPPFKPEEHGGGKETSEDKMVFLELLLKYPDKKQEIFKLWDLVFGDAWLDRIKPLLVEDEIDSNHRQTIDNKKTPEDDGKDHSIPVEEDHSVAQPGTVAGASDSENPQPEPE